MKAKPLAALRKEAGWGIVSPLNRGDWRQRYAVRVLAILDDSRTPGGGMGRQLGLVLYVVVMVVIIVAVDVAFLKNRFWPRLMVNIGIVLVFAAVYAGFLRHR